MGPEHILGVAMVGALCLYVLMAGADFGGGVWDLLASGPHRAGQRALIERALGPIWEANHVWLILVVVMLFCAFPPAFAAISVAFHVPLTVFLIGVVLRGSAFTFRAYESRGNRVQLRWGLVFSLASVIAPVALGVVVGAIASGRVRVDHGRVTTGFVAPWLAPFPVAVGIYALALFAFLAATYLAHEAGTLELQTAFRIRALWAGGAVGVLAAVTFALSFSGAPQIRLGLTERPWTWPLHGATALAALSAFAFLWRRRFALARLAAAAQAALILVGWAASQYPALVVPDVTLSNAAGNPKTLRLLIVALAVGLALLAPALYALYRLFKGERAFALRDRP